MYRSNICIEAVVEKGREKKKLYKYIAFICLEKAYERVCRKELWRYLFENGVEKYLVTGDKEYSLYEGSSAYAR